VQQRLVQSSWATNTLTMKDSLKIRHNRSSHNDSGACYPVPLTIRYQIRMHSRTLFSTKQINTFFSSQRFSPKKNSAYSCRFRFTCEFGNEFDVVFQGEGTFEEHLHNPVVPTPK
jgi:hypothetical protein